jgi:protein arginine N-methyltransferase 3
MGNDSQISSPPGSNSSDELGWLDVEPEGELSLTFKSLLDDALFPDAKSMLDHCREKYGLDFLVLRQSLNLDFHGTVKLINFSKVHHLAYTWHKD